MYKKTFLILLTTLIVCQSVTAGFFKQIKQDPKEQLKAAIRASSYSDFATTFKENYQPKLIQGVQQPSVPDFSIIKDKMYDKNEKKLAKLRKEPKYNVPIMAQGLACTTTSIFGLSKWVDIIMPWRKDNTVAEKFGFFFEELTSPFNRYFEPSKEFFMNYWTAAAVAAGLSVYGAKKVYDGIYYKQSVKNKIKQNKQIKKLIITSRS